MEKILSKSSLEAVNNCIKPSYIPAEHASGIVHIGIGAFHKAHQAVFTDDILSSQGGNWRITAVSLRNTSARDQLAPQNGLYTLVEKSEASINYRVIGSIEKVIVAPENPMAVIELLSQETIKIVTLTITEKGYCQTNGFLDLNNPDIKKDLENPLNPTTMPGFIVAACAARRKQQKGGFTVISCDNLPHNGRITRAIILAFAEQRDNQLATWINRHVSFCNSMVDRIVPATTHQDIVATENHLGVTDNATVVSEPFKQWVIEDNFCSDRPRWEDVGAILVKDVTLYEKMKLRLLNGSHSALAYLGFLSGHDYIHQAIANPDLLRLVEKLMNEEITVTLEVPDDFDLAAYKHAIRSRFTNSLVPYKTTQVANDGSQKLPQRLLAAGSELLQKGLYPATIALIVAAWFRFLEAESNDGKPMEINDPMAKTLTPIARNHRFDEAKQVDSLIAESAIFPKELIKNTQFIHDVENWLASIHQHGAAETIKTFLSYHE